jgi:hypothetical protein
VQYHWLQRDIGAAYGKSAKTIAEIPVFVFLIQTNPFVYVNILIEIVHQSSHDLK